MEQPPATTWTHRLSPVAARSARVQRAQTTLDPDIHDLLVELHYKHGKPIENAQFYNYHTHAIPGPDFLKRLQEVFPGDYELIEAMTIAKRLAVIQDPASSSSSVSRHTSLLPPVYWQAALTRLNDPDHWQARAQPHWADAMLPIATEGEYLRAVRNALGIGPSTVAHDVGLSEATIRRAENSNHGAASMKSALLRYYGQQEAMQRGQGSLSANVPTLIDMAAFRRCDATDISAAIKGR